MPPSSSLILRKRDSEKSFSMVTSSSSSSHSFQRRQACSHWDGKIKALKSDRRLKPKDRSRLIALAVGRKTEVIESLKKEMSGKRAELRQQTPFNRWNVF